MKRPGGLDSDKWSEASSCQTKEKHRQKHRETSRNLRMDFMRCFKMFQRHWWKKQTASKSMIKMIKKWPLQGTNFSYRIHWAPDTSHFRNTDGHFGMAEAIAILETILDYISISSHAATFNIFQYFYPIFLLFATDITLEGSCGSCGSCGSFGSCEMASTFCAPPWRQRILSSITAPTGRNSNASERGEIPDPIMVQSWWRNVKDAFQEQNMKGKNPELIWTIQTIDISDDARWC